MTHLKPNDQWPVITATATRDLSGVHESDECNCEQCRRADEYEREQRQQALKTLAEAGVFSGPPLDAIQVAFDCSWDRAPLVIRESVEKDICEYFYRLGDIHGRQAMTATTNDDLKEMRRLAGERLR